ncbi:MAG: hypothetical protein Q7K34_01970 [archaeon]|nr:hypothetical protein [archaeon]
MKEKLAVVLAVVFLPVFFLAFDYPETKNAGQAVLFGSAEKTASCGENKYCGEKTEVTCNGCKQEQLALLRTMSEYQETVAECLSDYFGFAPPKKIFYIVREPKGTLCTRDACINEGISFNGAVSFAEFPSITRFGELPENGNIQADVHETAHAFEFHALGSGIPKWFDEGLAIQTDARLNCHPKQFPEKRMGDEKLGPVLLQLKNGEKISEIIAHPTEHDRGAAFFYALEKELECGKECAARLFKQLHALRVEKIAQGKGFSHASPFPTNEIIKQETEKITGKDASWLFEALEISK